LIILHTARTTGSARQLRRSGPRSPRWAAVGLSLLLLAACAGGAQEPDASDEPDDVEVGAEPAGEEDDLEGAAEGAAGHEDGTEAAGDDEGAAVEDGEDPSTGSEVDPAAVGADELGVVPVMMYHQIREDGGSEWDMTPDEFRAELTLLFDRGFVPIRTVDLVRGDIHIPAGRSPVVLTFDDSPRSQARLDEDGDWADGTAMAILTEVAAHYDEVEPIASFYLITSSMFGAVDDVPDIVRALHEQGVELGNHTHNHANLRSLDADQVQEELARVVVEITDIVPDAEVVTMSLPFGISPEDRDLLAEGSSDVGSYTNEAVLLVGDRPAPSPFHVDFAPLSIPRIKTMSDPEAEFASAWWLDVMESSDTWRPYVSDGDPHTISFPAERADELHPDLEDRANPY